ncbi:hypothetical protein [Flavobacterium beibuense]|uniref:hypothetical protein n=1 Tax=Flavobacterium beibuense TaxID=657326 RepID=UPI003A95991F
MDVNGSKIKALIEHYGQQKNYEEKSYLVKFAADHGLNYKQWNNYIRGNQAAGIKIVSFLIEVFPDLNLNWLLKDQGNMFAEVNSLPMSQEPSARYGKKIDNSDIYRKLEEIQNDIKKIKLEK